MKDRFLILYSVLIVILQTTLFPFIEIAGVHPSLPLIFLISGTVVFGHWKGLRIALYLALPMDILIGRGLGVYVFLFLIISYVISSIEEQIFKDNIVTAIILFFSASIFEILFFTLFKYLVSGYTISLSEFFIQLFVYSLYNSILGIPIYARIMKKYMGYSIR